MGFFVLVGSIVVGGTSVGVAVSVGWGVNAGVLAVLVIGTTVLVAAAETVVAKTNSVRLIVGVVTREDAIAILGAEDGVL